MGPRIVYRCLVPLIVLIFFCRDVAGGGSWCVASPSASEAALQNGLNYACGQGGADCSAIQPDGNCFNPNTLHDHASYAYNSYYQKAPESTCDFSGSATLTTTDPSTTTCKYSSTRQVAMPNTGDHLGETWDKVKLA